MLKNSAGKPHCFYLSIYNGPRYPLFAYKRQGVIWEGYVRHLGEERIWENLRIFRDAEHGNLL